MGPDKVCILELVCDLIPWASFDQPPNEIGVVSLSKVHLYPRIILLWTFDYKLIGETHFPYKIPIVIERKGRLKLGRLSLLQAADSGVLFEDRLPCYCIIGLVLGLCQLQFLSGSLIRAIPFNLHNFLLLIGGVGRLRQQQFSLHLFDFNPLDR